MNEAIARRTAENAQEKLRALRRIEKKRIEVRNIMGKGVCVAGMERQSDVGVRIMTAISLIEEELNKKIPSIETQAVKIEHHPQEQKPNFAEKALSEITKREDALIRKIKRGHIV